MKVINFKKVDFSPLVCVAVVCFQLLVFNSWSQTFGGGTGTSGDPYKISTPKDLVELSAYVNSDPDKSSDNSLKNTYGKYFVMTNNIDMANVQDFVPIGQCINYKGGRFCGNFDGKGFAIKNLTITTCSNTENVALFGYAARATISNLTIENAYISGESKYPRSVSTFVGMLDTSTMSNCTAINCTLKANTSSIIGFVNHVSGGSVNNCHVINVKMEGRNVYGFCAIVAFGGQIINSSVTHSLLASTDGMSIGFGAAGGLVSGCFVSDCDISSEWSVYGFTAGIGEGKIDNCYVQASLSRTEETDDTWSEVFGFAKTFGTSGGEGQTPQPAVISNCYTACEITTGDDVYSTLDASFGENYLPNATFTNNYYLIHPQLPAFSGTAPTGGVTSKSETELKDAAMVANAANSLNHNQSSPLPWKQDLTPSINKGYPVLSWQKHVSYVSTYYPKNLTETSATLQGFVFTNGEPIAERGFQWREKGTGNWTKVTVTDTTFNISYALAGLTKNTSYECFVYMKAPTIQHGDTVQFTTLGDTVGIVNYLPGTSNISIYPNPTDGQLRITNYELRENTTIEIFSIVGQVVGTYRIRPEATKMLIDISHLSNGIYFMKIDGKTAKIVKQ